MAGERLFAILLRQAGTGIAERAIVEEAARHQPVTVPTILLEGDARNAPNPADPATYGQKFTGKSTSRIVNGRFGHDLP